jgi:GIY-YIG catalytic domain-containing protein
MFSPESLNLETLPAVSLENRKRLPQTAGIYFAIDAAGAVQYIGQSINLRQRWKGHPCQGYIANGGRIAYLEVSDPTLLKEIETALIQWFEPPLNDRRCNLAPKIISFRLLLESYDLFMELAKEEGKSPTILAREVLERYIAERRRERDSA